MKFGLYYSLYEWFNPHYLRDKANGFKSDEYIKVSKLRGSSSLTLIIYATLFPRLIDETMKKKLNGKNQPKKLKETLSQLDFDIFINLQLWWSVLGCETIFHI